MMKLFLMLVLVGGASSALLRRRATTGSLQGATEDPSQKSAGSSASAASSSTSSASAASSSSSAPSAPPVVEARPPAKSDNVAREGLGENLPYPNIDCKTCALLPVRVRYDGPGPPRIPFPVLVLWCAAPSTSSGHTIDSRHHTTTRAGCVAANDYPQI